MLCPGYSDIDQNIANSDYDQTLGFITDDCIKIIAKAVDLCDGYGSGSLFSISDDSSSVFENIKLPEYGSAGDSVVSPTAQTGQYNIMDITELSNDLRKQVNDLDSFLESCHSYSVGYDRLLKYLL